MYKQSLFPNLYEHELYDPDFNRSEDPILLTLLGDHTAPWVGDFTPRPRRKTMRAIPTFDGLGIDLEFNTIFRFGNPPGWEFREYEGDIFSQEYIDKIARPGNSFDIRFDNGSTVQFTVLGHKTYSPYVPGGEVHIRVTHATNINFVQGGKIFNRRVKEREIKFKQAGYKMPTIPYEDRKTSVEIVDGVARWAISDRDFFLLTAFTVHDVLKERRANKWGARIVEHQKKLQGGKELTKGMISSFFQKRTRPRRGRGQTGTRPRRRCSPRRTGIPRKKIRI